MRKSPTDHHLIAILSVFLLALCATGIANAQRVTACSTTTPNNAICIEWNAVTTDVDNKPLTTPVTYRVEQRAGTTGNFTQIATGVTATRLYVENLAPGTYFFRGYANCSGSSCVESVASNVVSRAATAVPVQPSAPVFTIAVVIGLDHAPVYRLTQAGKRDERYHDACGYIEVGKQCHGPVAFRFRDSSFRRVNDTDVKPWKVDCSGNVAAPCA